MWATARPERSPSFSDSNGQTDASSLTGVSGSTYVGDHPSGTGTYFQLDGYIELTGGVTYTFKLDSDDGSALSINGSQLIDDDGQHADSGPTPVTYTPASTGLVPIEIRYFENDNGPAALFAQFKAGDGSYADLTGAPVLLPAAGSGCWSSW